MNSLLQRVNIVGCCGSGKTTLGRDLARRLQIPAFDLDEWIWLPNWQIREETEFRILVRRALEDENWVISGNYSRLRPEIWARAQTVVWLDYSFSTVMRQLLRRTFLRNLRGDLCCNGNRETLRRTFSRDSILLWGFRTYFRRRREFPALFSLPEHAHLQITRFHSPRQTRDWLAQMEPFSSHLLNPLYQC